MACVSAEEKKEKTPARIPELDGIRGAAILLILIWHYYYCFIYSKIIPPPDLNHLQKICVTLCSLTWSGVDLFFVLSGFLIGGILLRYKGDSKNYFGTFYSRRILRIFPIYFLLYFAVLVFSSSAGSSAVPLWSYPLFIQNIFMTKYHTYGPAPMAITWSLAIEEQFYLVMPLVIYYAGNKILLFILLLMIALAPFVRSMAFLFGISKTYYYSHTLLFCRMDALAAGVLIAFLFRDSRIREMMYAKRIFLYVIFVVLLFILILMGMDPIPGNLRYTLFALMYGILLILALTDRGSFLCAVLRNPALRTIGIVSYGMYLYHVPVYYFISGLFPRQGVSGYVPLIVGLFSGALTFVIAIISYYCFEVRFLNAGHRIKF